MKTRCELCFHHCTLDEGQIGLCRARGCRGGKIVSLNYGKLTSLALDPIEKKPLRRFHPGSLILSVGSFGCNLRCPFCQNHEISMASDGEIQTVMVTPEQLAAKAAELVPQGNIGVAYTYNEPLIGYEYVRDCAALIHERGLANVLVTNGTIETAPWRALLPFLDAINIDLKGVNPFRSWADTADTPWIVQYHDGTQYREAPSAQAGEEAAAADQTPELPVNRAALDYIYPHLAASNTPTKLTATQLKGREKDHEIADRDCPSWAGRGSCWTICWRW